MSLDPGVDLAGSLRAAFRGQPAGVAVLTAPGPDGPVGMTASSVASVSTDPAALSFSVHRDGAAARAVLGAGRLVVHLLDAVDADLAHRFATPGADRFGPGTRWVSLPAGEPWLVDVGTALRCRVLSTVDVGAAVLVAAGIVEVLGLRRRGGPLVHVDRGYRTVAPGAVRP